MALFDLLRTTDGFTDTDQAIAQYVMEHPDEVAELNIGELAKATHTSNAAVTRFCHKLGLEGYRAFRLELTRERERARLHVFDVNPDLPFMENATTQETMDSILNLSRNALEEAHQTITPESVSLAARLICEARRVAIYAVGDSAVSVNGFMNLLTKVDIPCLEGMRNGDNLVVSNILSARDVAVLVTHSGLLFSKLEEPLKNLRSRGCKVIAITSYERLDAHVPGIECVIALPKRETRSGRVATFYSQACIRYALNCIYGEIFSRNWQHSMESNRSYTKLDHWENRQEDAGR